jgi:hypothetical protein
MRRWRWEMGVMDCRRRASRAEVVRFAKIWLLLLLMLICCERKNTVSSLKSIAKVTLKKQGIYATPCDTADRLAWWNL